MVTAIATSSWRSVTRPAAATRSGPGGLRVRAPPEVGEVVGEVRDDLEEEGDGEAAERGVQAERRARPRAPLPAPRRTPARAAGSVFGRRGEEPGPQRTGGPRTRAGAGTCRAGAGGPGSGIGHGRRGYLRVVGRPLLEERRRPLVRLVGRVVEAGRVAGELLEPGQPVRRDEEGGLEEADRRGAHVQDLLAHCDALGLEVGERHDLVHEPHVERLGPSTGGTGTRSPSPSCRRRGAPGGRPEAGVEAAHLRAHLPEDRVLARERQVAHDVEHVSAADRVPVDERDDRHRQRADLALEVEDVEARDPVVADVAAGVALVLLVAPRAERLVALAGEEHAADRSRRRGCGRTRR
jgi:hypothetical protein